MTLAAQGIFWVFAYLGVVIAPLVFAALGAAEPDHGFWRISRSHSPSWGWQ